MSVLTDLKGHTRVSQSRAQSETWAAVLFQKALLVLNLTASGAAVGLGVICLSLNTLEAYPQPLLRVLAGLNILSLIVTRWVRGKWDWKLIWTALASFAAGVLLYLTPEFVYGANFNALVHHSLISAILLISIGLASFCFALFHLLGASPTASDRSYYPLVIFPIALILGVYGLIIYQIFQKGLPNLSWDMLTTPYVWRDWVQEVWENDWPVWANQSMHLSGISHYILGTLELVFLTAAISLPIGIAVGIFITEYSQGWLSSTIRYSCTALKSISVFILALTAITLVSYARGTFLSDIIAGYFYDPTGFKNIGRGSFITASIIISLIVIPVIARATEEGMRSAPREMKEGSAGLGATREYTLFNVLLPWATPNIITGLLIGCAETAGSLATIWFIGSTGEFSVNPLNPVTSLTYFIFLCRGDTDLRFVDIEGVYQYSAALILILITIGLCVAALLLKRSLHKRYRSA